MAALPVGVAPRRGVLVALVARATIVTLLACSAGCAGSQARSDADPPPARRRLSPADVEADASLFLATLDSVHVEPYRHVTRDELRSLLESVIAALPDSLDERDAFVALQPVIARLGDAHTRLVYPAAPYQRAGREGARFVPFNLLIADRRAFVARRGGDDIPAPGTEVLSLGDRSIGSVLDSLGRLVSAERDAFREQLVEWNFRALYWAAFGSGDSLRLGLGSPSQDRAVRMATAGELRARNGSDPDPPTLAYEVIEPDRIAVVTIRSMISDGEAFRRFLATTFTAIRRDAPRALVIDLRENGGGNAQRAVELLPYVTAKPFRLASRVETRSSAQLRRRIRSGLPGWLHWVPDATFAVHPRGRAIVRAPIGTVVVYRPPMIEPGRQPLRYGGPVYVLIGRATFSAATTMAAMVADHELATLVGEETGGLGSAFTDIHRFVLPRTGLVADIALRLHVRPSGVEDGRGVLPDVEVRTSAGDRALGRDPVMDRVRELVRSATPEPGGDAARP